MSTVPSSFNPRSPCGERPRARSCMSGCKSFQPTLPLRGATAVLEATFSVYLVSTHAPLAGSDIAMHGSAHRSLVSTHAPLAGSDSFWQSPCRLCLGFNPRSPCGERLRCGRENGATDGFNPRSPCGERPPCTPHKAACGTCFNPRSPCGERRRPYAWTWASIWFQPTLPLRGATDVIGIGHVVAQFQPTLPLRGATRYRAGQRL